MKIKIERSVHLAGNEEGISLCGRKHVMIITIEKWSNYDIPSAKCKNCDTIMKKWALKNK